MWRVCEIHNCLVADVCIVGHQTVWGPRLGHSALSPYVTSDRTCIGVSTAVKCVAQRSKQILRLRLLTIARVPRKV